MENATGNKKLFYYEQQTIECLLSEESDNNYEAQQQVLKKQMTKKFIDHTTCPVSLLFSEHYFKLYIYVNKIIADCVFFISTVGDQQAVAQIKKILKIFHFISQNFLN